jgi:hypothetical protein
MNIETAPMMYDKSQIYIIEEKKTPEAASSGSNPEPDQASGMNNQERQSAKRGVRAETARQSSQTQKVELHT